MSSEGSGKIFLNPWLPGKELKDAQGSTRCSVQRGPELQPLNWKKWRKASAADLLLTGGQGHKIGWRRETEAMTCRAM